MKVSISTKKIGCWVGETDLNEYFCWERRRWWELKCDLPGVACQLADEHVHSFKKTQHVLPAALASVKWPQGHCIGVRAGRQGCCHWRPDDTAETQWT